MGSGRILLCAVGLSALLCACGCSTRIIPPPHPQHPVTVYVADYGRHSSLILPTDDAHLLEYAYGDWEYYALKQYNRYLGAVKLFFSHGAGLGRRTVLQGADNVELIKILGRPKRLLRFEVERQDAMFLVRELDQRFYKHIDTLVYNDYEQLYFVRDDAHYSLTNTCNHVTAQWLRKLGCRIEGWAVLSNFKVVTVSANGEHAARPISEAP